MKAHSPSAEGSVSRSLRLMGNTFSFTLVHQDLPFAEECLDLAIREIRRIEALLTTFSEDSETAAINRAAGGDAVVVSPETFALIGRAQKISALTQGAFDITYGSIDKRFWNFDLHMTELPSREAAKAAVHLVDYRNVELDPQKCTVRLKYPGMRIGFGGIGKGYAADAAARLLQEKGVEGGVVNASGDLKAWGHAPGGRDWTIGVADPTSTDKLLSSFPIRGLAVATSGDYEKYVVINGRRYSHTIDPKTGFPVSGIRSVTVICSSAELADALCTPVMIMGVKAGLSLINQMRGIACTIVDDGGTIFTSDNIRKP